MKSSSSLLITTFLFVTLFTVGEALQAKTVYVKSFRGIIKSAPKGKVIAKVTRGTKLNQTGQQGIWAKVTYKSRKGYISKMFISSRKPAVRPVRFNALRNPNVIARRRASAEVTAASARGAADENEMLKLRGGTLKNSKIDLTEVKNMETYEVSNNDIEKFLAESNINPQ